MSQGTPEPRLSIVIPAYNEAHRLPASLGKVVEFCGGLAFPHEILVVVEKSTDGTLELAMRAVSKQANFHVIDNQVQRGKGYAVRSGMLRARGAHVFYMDADLSVPLPEILKFLDYFVRNPPVDVLIGNRKHAQSEIVVRQNVLRRKMGECFNGILQALTRIELRDTQCGFKAFRRDAAREIFTRQKLDGFAFDVEVLLLAERLGFKCADLPVQWINSPESKVSIVRDSLKMLLDTLRVRRLVARTLRESPQKNHSR
jgi:dolichyl-phosphate beta-glucosyltransferase